MNNNLPNPFAGSPELFKPAQVIMSQSPNSKSVRAGNNGLHIVFILDESSSMTSSQQSTIGGFNEYIETQKKNMTDDTWVSVVKFNGDKVTTLFDTVDINDIEPLNENTYKPNGMTNLRDAIGFTIVNIDKQLKAKKKKSRPSVLFVIFTDGMENTSKHFTSNSQIKEMVSAREEKDWAFTFFGANIDAFSTGSSMGFNSSSTVQYNTTNMEGTFQAASNATSAYRSMRSKGMSTQEVYDSGLYSNTDRNGTL